MKEKLANQIINAVSDLATGWGIELNPDSIELLATPSPEHGDFALNIAMKWARFARMAPLAIAEQIKDKLTGLTVFSRVVAVAPGYINVTLSDDFLAGIISDISCLNHGLEKTHSPKRVVVDYSGVNIAKQMHVGHLRSTIIGDVIARVLEARGDTVIRQNHLGDWGLPIAMVLSKAKSKIEDAINDGKNPEGVIQLSDLETLYKAATKESAENEEYAKEVHDILVKLQNGDDELMELWHIVTNISMNEVYDVYKMMNITLHSEHEKGESSYRDMLAATVKSIEDSGVCEESQGAKCVFLPKFKGKNGEPLPVIVQKSDGGFNYETFDLAALRYRIVDLQADRIIYVTDARQALHFDQVFEVAKKCGWTGDNVSLEHVAFGAIMGEDKKPLKTRSGENVKLVSLLNEAVDRARLMVEEKNPNLSDEAKDAVSKIVGIGAVKYADMVRDRNNDYVFSWDGMLAMVGNTAPYLQYAHARISSIFRKGDIDAAALQGTNLLITHAAERALILKIIEFSSVVQVVAVELRPHHLCTYLYELASAFSSFYDACSVLNADDEAIKQSRLFLCQVTRKTLASGLDLLGIIAPEEM